MGVYMVLIVFMNLLFCRDDLHGRLQGLIVFMNLFFCRDVLYARLQGFKYFWPIWPSHDFKCFPKSIYV